jgi:predicted nucleic acid-binding protein
VILVVDASVAVKWLHDEAGSPEAGALLVSGDTLIAPDLIVPEVCNVIWKMARRGMMSRAQQMVAVMRLTTILDELAPTGPLATRAVAISSLLDHPASDCFYLALAEQRGGIVVSADRRLIQRVSGTPWKDLVTDPGALPSESG